VVSAKILPPFARAEHLGLEAPERLVASITRPLDQDPPLLASMTSSVSSRGSWGSGQVAAIDTGNADGAWVLDRL